jgi:hypothetical protein
MESWINGGGDFAHPPPSAEVWVLRQEYKRSGGGDRLLHTHLSFSINKQLRQPQTQTDKHDAKRINFGICT